MAREESQQPILPSPIRLYPFTFTNTHVHVVRHTGLRSESYLWTHKYTYASTITGYSKLGYSYLITYFGLLQTFFGAHAVYFCTAYSHIDSHMNNLDMCNSWMQKFTHVCTLENWKVQNSIICRKMRKLDFQYKYVYWYVSIISTRCLLAFWEVSRLVWKEAAAVLTLGGSGRKRCCKTTISDICGRCTWMEHGAGWRVHSDDRTTQTYNEPMNMFYAASCIQTFSEYFWLC